MGMITSTRQAQLGESQRRLAWEQEQEVKYAQRQADMEHKMLEMFEEIKALRSTINALNNNNSASAISSSNAPSPPTSHLPTTPASLQLASPSLPALQPLPHPLPQRMPVRKSPINSLDAASSSNESNAVQSQSCQEHTFQISLVPSTYDVLTPGTSPQVESPEQVTSTSPGPRRRKEKRKPSPSSDNDGSTSSSSSSAAPRRPRKRRNHHDTQCYTMHVCQS